MALVLKSMSPVSETPRRWRSHLMAGKTRPTNQLSGKSLNMHEGKKNRQNHYNGFCQLCKRIVHFFILNWVVLSPYPFWFWFRSPFLFVWSDTRLTGHHRQVVYILFIFFTHVCSDLRTAARLYMVAFCQHFLRKFNHESNTNFYEWSVFIMIRWNNFFDTIFSQLYLSSGIYQDRTQVYPKSCWIRKKPLRWWKTQTVHRGGLTVSHGEHGGDPRAGPDPRGSGWDGCSADHHHPDPRRTRGDPNHAWNVPTQWNQQQHDRNKRSRYKYRWFCQSCWKR